MWSRILNSCGKWFSIFTFLKRTLVLKSNGRNNMTFCIGRERYNCSFMKWSYKITCKFCVEALSLSGIWAMFFSKLGDDTTRVPLLGGGKLGLLGASPANKNAPVALRWGYYDFYIDLLFNLFPLLSYFCRLQSVKYSAGDRQHRGAWRYVCQLQASLRSPYVSSFSLPCFSLYQS